MQPGELVDGRFELLEVAGAGGMGVVFRANDRATGNMVALKVIGARYDEQRFARETAHLAAVSDPRVVRFVAHGTTGSGQRYLVMEWVEGENLEHRLERSGITLGESVEVARGLSSALGALHSRGLVHRDVKPSNVMFEHGVLSRIKLIDFGIARSQADGRGLTATGMMIGTPGYMSPEQARGVRDVDARADVFALGCVLFECMTGWNAFAGEHSIAVRTKILLAPPPPLRELCPEAPAPLIDLVHRMLAKTPDERPRDGHAVAEELGALGAMPPGPVRSTSTEEAQTLVVRAGVASSGFIVLVAARADDPTPQIPGAASAAIARAIEAIEPAARVIAIDHDVLVVRVPGGPDARGRAQLALRCARACRAELPSQPIAIAALPAEATVVRGARDAIDRAVDGLVRAVMIATGGAVFWMDDTTRALVGDAI